MIQRMLMKFLKEQGLKVIIKLLIDVLNDVLQKMNQKDGALDNTPTMMSKRNTPHA